MDTIKTLCQGQDAATRRRILAAYYRGISDALKARGTALKRDVALLRNQAD